jgi:predicted nucleic acid-binding protein
LIVAETSSQAVLQEFERDPELLVWWEAEVECASTLARQERDGGLTGTSFVDSLRRLDALSQAWREVQPVGRVRQIATRLLRVHSLHAAEALQLGAAIVASEDQPATLPLVTLDKRLARAGEREGFVIIRPDRAG